MIMVMWILFLLVNIYAWLMVRDFGQNWKTDLYREGRAVSPETLRAP